MTQDHPKKIRSGGDHMEAPHDPLYAGFHPQGHPLYEMAGWNLNTGRPTNSKLAELGIEGAAAGR